MQPADQRPKAHLIAHRGWSRHFPENTLPAFAAAVAARADEIEFDVRVSRDQVPVICHDRVTNRVSNLEGPCSGFTLQELKSAHIRMPDGSFAAGLGFTTLREVIDMFGNKIGMNIHIKELGEHEVALRQLTDYITEHNIQGVYVAGNAAVLSAAMRICPQIPRCCLEQDRDGALLLENALKFQCRRLQFFKGYYQLEHVHNALEAGLITNLYWADDPQEAAQVIESGIVGLLTNDIGPMRNALLRAGIIA